MVLKMRFLRCQLYLEFVWIINSLGVQPFSFQNQIQGIFFLNSYLNKLEKTITAHDMGFR